MPSPETPSTPRVRDPLFDVAKALMMFWVVWGHFSRWGVVAGPLEPDPYMANAKIAVNMPVFFAIGGYLALSTFENGSWRKILVRVIGFLWPMASFGVVFALASLALHGWTGWRWLESFPVRQVLYGHWFLRTFAAVYLISAVAYRAFKAKRTRAIAFAVVYMALLFWPARLHDWLFWLGGEPTIHMFPFFVAGLFLFRRLPLWKSSRTAIVCVVFFLVVLASVRDFDSSGLNFWSAPTHWRSVFLTGGGIAALAGRIALGLSGTIALLGSLERILRRFPHFSTLAVFGTTTLGVYVLHEWPLVQLGKAGLPVLPLPCWTRWPLALAWFLLCHAIVAGLRRVPSLKFAFFGPTTHDSKSCPS